MNIRDETYYRALAAALQREVDHLTRSEELAKATMQLLLARLEEALASSDRDPEALRRARNLTEAMLATLNNTQGKRR